LIFPQYFLTLHFPQRLILYMLILFSKFHYCALKLFFYWDSGNDNSIFRNCAIMNQFIFYHLTRNKMIIDVFSSPNIINKEIGIYIDYRNIALTSKFKLI